VLRGYADFFRVDFFAVGFFDPDFFAEDFLDADFFAADFFEADFFADDFFEADFFAEDFFDPPFFAGTFAPARRASDSPIAIACLRLVTFLPEPPLRSFPALRSCITFLTFDCAFFPYFAMSLLLVVTDGASRTAVARRLLRACAGSRREPPDGIVPADPRVPYRRNAPMPVGSGLLSRRCARENPKCRPPRGCNRSAFARVTLATAPPRMSGRLGSAA
jgi:hypothetical protein